MSQFEQQSEPNELSNELSVSRLIDHLNSLMQTDDEFLDTENGELMKHAQSLIDQVNNIPEEEKKVAFVTLHRIEFESVLNHLMGSNPDLISGAKKTKEPSCDDLNSSLDSGVITSKIKSIANKIADFPQEEIKSFLCQLSPKTALAIMGLLGLVGVEATQVGNTADAAPMEINNINSVIGKKSKYEQLSKKEEDVFLAKLKSMGYSPEHSNYNLLIQKDGKHYSGILSFDGYFINTEGKSKIEVAKNLLKKINNKLNALVYNGLKELGYNPGKKEVFHYQRESSHYCFLTVNGYQSVGISNNKKGAITNAINEVKENPNKIKVEPREERKITFLAKKLQKKGLLSNIPYQLENSANYKLLAQLFIKKNISADHVEEITFHQAESTGSFVFTIVFKNEKMVSGNSKRHPQLGFKRFLDNIYEKGGDKKVVSREERKMQIEMMKLPSELATKYNLMVLKKELEDKNHTFDDIQYISYEELHGAFYVKFIFREGDPVNGSGTKLESAFRKTVNNIKPKTKRKESVFTHKRERDNTHKTIAKKPKKSNKDILSEIQKKSPLLGELNTKKNQEKLAKQLFDKNLDPKFVSKAYTKENSNTSMKGDYYCFLELNDGRTLKSESSQGENLAFSDALKLLQENLDIASTLERVKIHKMGKNYIIEGYINEKRIESIGKAEGAVENFVKKFLEAVKKN